MITLYMILIIIKIRKKLLSCMLMGTIELKSDFSGRRGYDALSTLVLNYLRAKMAFCTLLTEINITYDLCTYVLKLKYIQNSLK